MAEEFEIHSIKDQDGNELKFERKGKAVYVFFKKEFAIGTVTKIITAYSGKPQIAKKPPWRGGLVWKKSDGFPFVGVACEDDGASIWWPLKDHISDKPDSVRMTFDVPSDLICVSNGRLISEEMSGTDRKKFVWQTSYPINQYNVTFYLANFKNFKLNYTNQSGPHALDFYVLPKNYEKAKKHFKQTAEVIEIFEKLFGEYPWWNDGFKMVESPYAGMEHQTAIAYGSGYENGKWLDYDYILVHETAHEWWGNAVTVCDMADLWIHEGFATYAEALYMEAKGEKSDYDWMMVLDRMGCQNRRPVVGPKDVAYTNFKDGDIYSKGSITLHSLREVLENDSVFFRIIYRFGTEYRDSCVTTQDFIDLVNQESQKDMTWVFKQLLYRPEAPELIYNYYSAGSGKDKFVYRWNSKVTNADYQMPIRITLGQKDFMISPTWKTQELILRNNSNLPLYIDRYVYCVFTKDENLMLR